MDKEILISVKNLKKTFKIPHERNNSLKGTVINLFKGKKGYTKYVAANGVSFDVKKGEFLGLIGRNGCGKSTMLKMIAGIYEQDSGKIVVNGSLSPFLELGVGFNPDLTARDNVYLNGTILGLTRKQIDDIFDDIIRFAELEEFVDMKLKNFSSGMQVRLAFSVAINAHSDIILIDEVLAVGDINFQKKCFDVFKDFKRQGKTIIFVTHSMGSVRSFCDRVVVLDKGDKIYDGGVEGAIDVYTKLNFEEEKFNKEPQASEHAETLGNHDAIITDYKIFDSKGEESSRLTTGQKFKAVIKVKFNKDIEKPSFGMMFRLEQNIDLLGAHSLYRKEQVKTSRAKKGDELVVTFEGTMPLESGAYYLTFKVSDEQDTGDHEILQMLNNFVIINVENKENYWGLIDNNIGVKITHQK